MKMTPNYTGERPGFVTVKAKHLYRLLAELDTSAKRTVLEEALEHIKELGAERDALRMENEAAHVYLDECYINDPDACDAGTKSLAGRIMDLDDAHGLEIVELRKQVEQAITQRDALQTEVEKLRADAKEWARATRAWATLCDLREEKYVELWEEVNALRAKIAAQEPKPEAATVRTVRVLHKGAEVRKVTVPWVCPKCGGHADYYSDVIAWAERYAKENGNG